MIGVKNKINKKGKNFYLQTFNCNNVSQDYTKMNLKFLQYDKNTQINLKTKPKKKKIIFFYKKKTIFFIKIFTP